MKPKYWLLFFSLYFFAISTAVFAFRYEHFMENSGDLAIHAQSFWNALQGRGFANTFEGGDHFGRHFTPIYYLLLLFYFFIPSVYTLQIVSILFFSLSVFPLYGILKDLFGEKIPFLFILFFYLHPTLYSIPEEPFRDTSLLPFLFLSAFYFYKKEKWGPFLVCVALCNATKEIVALPMALFGLVGWLEKRSWKWVLAPFFISAIWFVVAVKGIMPLYQASALGHEWKAHLGYLGKNYSEIFGNLFRPEVWMERIDLKRKAVYFLRMLLPFGFVVPFFTPYWVFAIPDALGIFFSKMKVTTSLDRPYGILIYIALFLSFIHVIARAGWLEKKKVALFFEKGVSVALACFLILPAVNLFLAATALEIKINSRDFFKVEKRKDFTETFEKLIARIPTEASLSAPPVIANHLTQREVLHLEISFEVDYLVLNQERRQPDIAKQVREFSYRPVFQENGWTLYQLVRGES